MIVINRRYVRGVATRTNENLYLKVDLLDWDWLRITQNSTVSLITDEDAGIYRITSVIRCPGGEPEAWLFLKRSGDLPKSHPSINEIQNFFTKQVPNE